MPSITRIDFVPIPTQDVERTTAFYRDTLGLEESPHTVDKPFSEFDLGGTTLSVWDPSTAGMEFAANTNTIALHTDDVAADRAELEEGRRLLRRDDRHRRLPHGDLRRHRGQPADAARALRAALNC